MAAHMMGSTVSSQRSGTGQSLSVVRGAVILTIGLVVLLVVLGIPTMTREIATPCSSLLCDRWQPTPQLASRLHAAGISLQLYSVYYVAVESVPLLGTMAMALVLLWRRPNERMALFGGFTIVTFTAAFSDPIVAIAMTSPVAWALRTLLAAAGWSSLFIFFYLFPNGRFVPRWTRVTSVAWLAFMLVNFFSQASWGTNSPQSAARLSGGPHPITASAILLFFVSVVLAQVYRYRRVSSPLERQQTRWVMCGFAGTFSLLAAVVVLAPLVLPASWPDSPIFQLVGLLIFEAVFLLLPMSFAVAILRYRLYDIDVLINRTLVYGSLTISLAVVYVGGVIALEALTRTVTGQRSDVAIAVVTLIVAALFNPWRRELQAFIDRRFYRRKYDAARTVAALSVRLRNDVDLSQVTADVTAAVQETLQPAYLALWLR